MQVRSYKNTRKCITRTRQSSPIRKKYRKRNWKCFSSETTGQSTETATCRYPCFVDFMTMSARTAPRGWQEYWWTVGWKGLGRKAARSQRNTCLSQGTWHLGIDSTRITRVSVVVLRAARYMIPQLHFLKSSWHPTSRDIPSLTAMTYQLPPSQWRHVIGSQDSQATYLLHPRHRAQPILAHWLRWNEECKFLSFVCWRYNGSSRRQ